MFRLLTGNNSWVASGLKYCSLYSKPISGRVHRASATEAVDWDSIPAWVKPDLKN